MTLFFPGFGVVPGFGVDLPESKKSGRVPKKGSGHQELGPTCNFRGPLQFFIMTKEFRGQRL